MKRSLLYGALLAFAVLAALVIGGATTASAGEDGPIRPNSDCSGQNAVGCSLR